MTITSKRADEGVRRSYKMRAYPTPGQVVIFERLCRAKCEAWNWAFNARQECYAQQQRLLGRFELSRMLTVHKPTSDGLARAPREMLDQVLRDFDQAFKNFWADRAELPCMKTDCASVRFKLRRFPEPADGQRHVHIRIPSLGDLRVRATRKVIGHVVSITVSRNGGGQFYVSVGATNIPRPARSDAGRTAVGIDRGMKTLAVIAKNDGTTSHAVAPKLDADERRKLKRLSRKAKRQYLAAKRLLADDPTPPSLEAEADVPESARRRRTRERIAKLHLRLRARRDDALHKLSHQITTSSQIICVEDLDVREMIETRILGRHFRRTAGEAMMGKLLQFVAYKADWRGREVRKVDRYFPSSKTCSSCGEVNRALKLSHRRWTCAVCGANHDRDVNAARNILAEGLRTTR